VGGHEHFPHSKGIKLQLTNDVGITVRFVVVSDSWNNNSSEVLHDIGSS
jgi:hypothetical protein